MIKVLIVAGIVVAFLLACFALVVAIQTPPCGGCCPAPGTTSDGLRCTGARSS